MMRWFYFHKSAQVLVKYIFGLMCMSSLLQILCAQKEKEQFFSIDQACEQPFI